MKSYFVEGRIVLSVETEIYANSAEEALELVRKRAEKDFNFTECSEETVGYGDERDAFHSICMEEAPDYYSAVADDDPKDEFHMDSAWVPNNFKPEEK